MKINRVKLVPFSPTGSTKRIMEEIAKGIQAPTELIDLTRPEAKTEALKEFNDELTIIGAPVYAGRLPMEAVRRFGRLKANNTPAVIVVVYGNRAYEDALIEMSDLVSEVGFKPIAGGAFVAEHSFSSHEVPIAEGRPDRLDLEKAYEFGKSVSEKVLGAERLEDISLVEVPGNHPYRDRFRKLSEPVSPDTKEELCTKCGKCAEVCPNGAITVGSIVDTRKDACILCYACIKYCPAGARVMQFSFFAKEAKWLHDTFPERKEPETFL